MLLGDVMARFDDPAVAAETLLSLDDLALVAAVKAAAAEQELTVGEFAVRALDRFAMQASDEDWVTLVGALARAADPGRAFLQRILAAAVSRVEPLPPARRDASSSEGSQR
jgi:hypothetical protein